MQGALISRTLVRTVWLPELELIDRRFHAHALDVFGAAIVERLAWTDRGAHRLLSDARSVEAHVALHHLVDFRNVVRYAKRACQHAVRASDAARLEGAVNDAVFGLLDRIRRTDSCARRILAVHADDGRGLRAGGAVDELEVNHGAATMRVAFHAGLHAGLAADAARRIDEELESVHDATFSIRQAQTLYSGILEIGSSARFVSRLADFLPASDTEQTPCPAESSSRPAPATSMSPRRVSNADHVSVRDSQLCCENRMHFAQRFGILIDERADPPRLSSAQVLRDDTARREEERIFRIDVLGGRPVFISIKSRFAVRVMKPSAFKEPRCAGMIERRARPEDSHVLLDLGVGHSAVVGGSALRSQRRVRERCRRRMA